MNPRSLIAALLACAALLALPQGAAAHAVLESTVPERGERLDAAPAAVELHFNEAVEDSFGAVRIYDGAGKQVETTSAPRPGGRSSAIAATVPSGLADGTYTVTYRVISADSHPVSGGFVFTLGEPGAGPGQTVSDLLAGESAGPVTGAAAGVARFASYAAIALGAGALIFALAVFAPARATARVSRESATAFAASLRALLVVATATGAVAGAAGIVLQGATGSGGTFFDALDADTIGEVLDTRFGTVWGLREIAWLALGAGALALRLDARRNLAILCVPAAFLVASPALAGHAATQSPGWLLVPADIVHVAAMSLWVGGIAALLICVRAATSRLDTGSRTRLLAATMARFSPLALVAVLALVATGTAQSIVHLEQIPDLWQTAFGRAIAVKVALLVALVGIGAAHRRRHLPALRAAAAGGTAPGRAGRQARQALVAEAALFAAVIVASAILVGQPPPSALAAEPQSASTVLGPAEMEVVVDPASAGANEVHVYLFDSTDGSQYDELRDVELEAGLPGKEIGPLELDLERAGPGHYVAPDAALGIAGDWELELSGRVSRFEALTGSVELEIR